MYHVYRWVFAITLSVGNASVWACLVAHQWYFGEWRCQIEGRPSQMQWVVQSAGPASCGVVGKFREIGGPFVGLKVKKSTPPELIMRYLGSDPGDWTLRLESSGKAIGVTSRGRPLRCQPQAEYEACRQACREQQEFCMKDARTGPQRGECAKEFKSCAKECSNI